MDKVKEILFRRHFIREILILFFIVLSLLFISIYTSFAIFTKSYEKTEIASIYANPIQFYISTPTSTSNSTTKSISVEANTSTFFDVTITNGSVLNATYKLYTTNTSSDVIVGVSENSDNKESGSITTDEKTKVVRVGIKNNTSTTVHITIGVQGGYMGNTITLDSERYPLTILEESYTDPSGANTPVLADGMIPVEYDDTNDVWVKANEESAWYSYGEQKWANAVTVTNTNRSTYMSAEAGTEISMDDINAIWVWIPRYKYKIPSNMGSSSNVTEPPEIDVVFENETEATGVDEVTYRTGITDDGTNANYYTHPAFRNINNITYDSSTTSRGAWDKEITGFWVGKFETGTSTEICNTRPSTTNCADVEPIIKPDVISLQCQNVSTQFITALKFAGGTMDTSTGVVTFSGNDTFGLSSSVDTHMMKNTEWGAVAILSQSQYGKMGNSNYTGTDKEVYINNTSIYTGRSGGSPSESSTRYGTYSYNDKACSASTCTGDKTAYKGVGASTTGTIYGIYDMNGGKYEYTMGNWAQTSGRSGFTTFPESKYYDLYQGTSSNTVKKAKAILGDATWETMHWYSDSAFDVTVGLPWVFRGGFVGDGNGTGVWSLNFDGPVSENNISFRSILIP